MSNLSDSAADAIQLLKTRGPQPLKVIASELGITTEGARFQLLKLSNEGLVEATSRSKGRGRPQQIWSLTDAANARFPDAHADLTANLINMIQETLGEEAIEKIIDTHERKITDRYRKNLEEDADLESKISRLAEIRTKEGYMADYEKDEEGYLFIENHCPICVAARHCQGFCSAELNTFRAVLGEGVDIERIDHIVAGARRCAYRIKSVPV